MSEYLCVVCAAQNGKGEGSYQRRVPAGEGQPMAVVYVCETHSDINREDLVACWRTVVSEAKE